MIKKPEDVPGATWPAIVVGMFVAFGGVLWVLQRLYIHLFQRLTVRLDMGMIQVQSVRQTMPERI